MAQVEEEGAKEGTGEDAVAEVREEDKEARTKPVNELGRTSINLRRPIITAKEHTTARWPEEVQESAYDGRQADRIRKR